MAAELPIIWSTAQTIPAKLNNKIMAEGASVNLEQFLLDLHSGRLIGNFGVYVMDIIAVLLIIQVITGCIAWANHQLLKRRR